MAPKRLREKWLNELASALRPAFKQIGAPLPRKIRMSCGWTGHGARASRIGECWATSASKDGTFEIFISPRLDKALVEGGQAVADVAAHELAHTAAGIDEGHGPAFKKIAEALGLTGKMTATTAGPEFVKLVKPILRKIGKYPHAEMRPGYSFEKTPDPKDPKAPAPDPEPRTTAPRKQTTRLLKTECSDCGYKARVTRTWLQKSGAPLCPCNSKPMSHDPLTE